MDKDTEVIKAFTDSMRGYHKYEMEWLAEHGYGVTDIAAAHSRYLEDECDKKNYTFENYLQDNGLEGGDIYASYGEWLDNEYADIMNKLAHATKPDDVRKAAQFFHDKGLMPDDQMDRINRHCDELNRMEKNK